MDVLWTYRGMIKVMFIFEVQHIVRISRSSVTAKGTTNREFPICFWSSVSYPSFLFSKAILPIGKTGDLLMSPLGNSMINHTKPRQGDYYSAIHRRTTRRSVIKLRPRKPRAATAMS